MILAALGLCLAQAGASPGPDAREIPLDQVFPYWMDYLEIPGEDRTAFRLTYRIEVSASHGDAWPSFWVQPEPACHHPLELDPDGRVDMPDASVFRPGARLVTDALEGGVRVHMQVELPAPLKDSYRLAEVEAALAQSANAMRALFGLRALMMPRLDAVRFEFEGPAPEAVWLDRDGDATPIESVYESVVIIQPDDRALQGADQIRFGEAPVSAVLEVSR